jgi:two-component system response regulator
MTAKKEVNILLVEDTEEHAVLMRRALEQGKLRPRLFVVTDGKAAIDFLYNQGDYTDREANPMPDIILLDLRLPKVHGLKVLERIKGDERLRDIPVAVLTASDEARDIVGCYRAGAESYITKSVAFLSKGEGPGAILDAVLSLIGTSDKEVVTHGT